MLKKKNKPQEEKIEGIWQGVFKYAYDYYTGILLANIEEKLKTAELEYEVYTKQRSKGLELSIKIKTATSGTVAWTVDVTNKDETMRQQLHQALNEIRAYLTGYICGMKDKIQSIYFNANAHKEKK